MKKLYRIFFLIGLIISTQSNAAFETCRDGSSAKLKGPKYLRLNHASTYAWRDTTFAFFNKSVTFETSEDGLVGSAKFEFHDTNIEARQRIKFDNPKSKGQGFIRAYTSTTGVCREVYIQSAPTIKGGLVDYNNWTAKINYSADLSYSRFGRENKPISIKVYNNIGYDRTYRISSTSGTLTVPVPALGPGKALSIEIYDGTYRAKSSIGYPPENYCKRHCDDFR